MEGLLPLASKLSHPKERSLRYNKQELDASLVVIRKVNKMDAAEPFNVPVNPEALGIPLVLYYVFNFIPLGLFVMHGEPVPTNKRHNAAKIFSHPYVASQEPWYI
ncbi:hypothetical protein HN51_005548 [Arachis hypogaea]